MQSEQGTDTGTGPGTEGRRQALIVKAVIGLAVLIGICYLFYLRYDVSPKYDVPWRVAGHYEKQEKLRDNPFSIAPHGKTIVYSTTASGHGNLWTMDLDGQNSKQLTFSPEYESGPCFSPDGRRIAFSRETDKCGHIWIMNADGTGATQLTSGPDYDSNPVFSADGKTIWFQRTPRGNVLWDYEILTMTSDGKNIGIWKPDMAGVVLTVSFAPDNSAIYMTRLDSNSLDAFQVWSINPDGTQAAGLSDGRVPTVSPDSETVAFVAGDAQNQLWRMPPDGSTKRSIYESESKKIYVSFAPDGHSLYFLERASDGAFISSVKLDGSGYHRLKDIILEKK